MLFMLSTNSGISQLKKRWRDCGFDTIQVLSLTLIFDNGHPFSNYLNYIKKKPAPLFYTTWREQHLPIYLIKGRRVNLCIYYISGCSTCIMTLSGIPSILSLSSLKTILNNSWQGLSSYSYLYFFVGMSAYCFFFYLYISDTKKNRK